jgi:predicted membrane protein
MELRKMLLAAMFAALALLLPFLTAQNYVLGQMLLPMHIPVLLCGFICGPSWGLAVGLIAPLLRFLLLGAPPMPTALTMAFELAAYGLLAGIFYRMLPKKAGFLFVALILAMMGGRVVWGAATYAVYEVGFAESAFTWKAFAGGAVLTAWPGILIQIALIPTLMIALRRTKILQEVTQYGNKKAAADPLSPVSGDADAGHL